MNKRNNILFLFSVLMLILSINNPSILLSQSTIRYDYSSITDVIFDGEKAVGKVAALELRYEPGFTYHGGFWGFWCHEGSSAHRVFLEKNSEYENTIRSMAKTGSKRTIAFRIIRLEPDFGAMDVMGKIIGVGY